ncbi:MAG: patatin-like phospholipase family protein [Panacagrimonas sp.]
MDVRALLSQTPLFASLTPAALDQLAASTRVRALASGETLIAPGTDAHNLFIVAVGRLRVLLPDGTLVAEIARLEPTGEIGLLSGEPRVATVYAVRDTKVLEIERDALFAIFQQHPAALLDISRTVIQRLRRNTRAATLASVRRPRSIALVAATPNVDAAGFARKLALALSHCGDVEVLDAGRVDGTLGFGSANTPIGDGEMEDRLIDWLESREMAHRHLVYCSGAVPGNWSRRCVRQADRILVLADGSEPPHTTAMIEDLRRSAVRAPIDLLLTRPEPNSAGRVLEWREKAGAQSHYFIRPGLDRDIDRVARSITGRAIGLVLGGGGARGFAHIGLLRAMEELGVDVDVLGGSSMGGLVAALSACGYRSQEMLELVRETFVTRDLLNDYLFPSVSLIRGSKFRKRLHDIFRDRAIEDLRTPYFCVSTNLTRGVAQVHDRGPLGTWLAASMCIPGVAPPVVYQGELLVDGAVINSLPVDIMQALGRGPIVASDVSTEGAVSAPGIEGPDPEGLLKWTSAEKRPSLFSILFRTATLTSESGVAARAKRADLYLRMPVGGIGVFDWKKLDEAVDRGYRYALDKLPEFRDTIVNQCPL